jgi:hypothetical protein
MCLKEARDSGGRKREGNPVPDMMPSVYSIKRLLDRSFSGIWKHKGFSIDLFRGYGNTIGKPQT